MPRKACKHLCLPFPLFLYTERQLDIIKLCYGELSI